MKLEKINNSKIKIEFSANELEENNISVHSFLANSIQSQKFFLAILEIANEDFGFNTINSKISYETFSFDNKQFVIFVTKSNLEPLSKFSRIYDFINFNTIPFSPRDIFISSNSTSNFIGNRLSNSQKQVVKHNISYYFFDNINMLFDFCNYINSSKINIPFENSLYKYYNLYFIEINYSNLSYKDINNLFSVLSEFKNTYIFSELSLKKILEFSDLLISNNAIQTLKQKKQI